MNKFEILVVFSPYNRDISRLNNIKLTVTNRKT